MLILILGCSKVPFSEDISIGWNQFKNDPSFKLEEPADSIGDSKDTNVTIDYGKHGLEIKTNDGRLSAWFGLRRQFRLPYPFDEDPITLDGTSISKSRRLIRKDKRDLRGKATLINQGKFIEGYR